MEIRLITYNTNINRTSEMSLSQTAETVADQTLASGM